jgi:uncharacterized protein YecT (DUF1311 family)
MRRFALASVFAVLASGAFAQGETEDPIDLAYSTCMDRPEAQSTQGMVECMGTAYHAWDKALNGAYAKLIETLDPATVEKLKASQRQWIAFRDAESEFLSSFEVTEGGTIMRLVTNEAMIDLVKSRVRELRSYDQGE